MFRVKKQISLIYILSLVQTLSLTSAWVALLSERGFSLMEIGFLETVFHITSLMFEIPSGMLADAYGRKTSMIISNIMFIIAHLVMALSSGIALCIIAMVFHALGYNFLSGSNDALAYDSLKFVGEEGRYEKYFSNSMIIYRIANAVSSIISGIAFVLGYRLAYLLSITNYVIGFFFIAGLKEIRIEDNIEREKEKGVFGKLYSYFRESIVFLFRNKKASLYMFTNSFVGAVDILLLFFLQSKLREAGMSSWSFGIALFVMQLGGVIGSKLILKFEKTRYTYIFVTCTIGVLLGVLLEHTMMPVLMTLGGIISSAADDALQVRSDRKLQDMFPSEQRATLISISSFTFSVIMIILSPLAGIFFTFW